MKITKEKFEQVSRFRRELWRDDVSPDIERIAGLFPRGYLSIVASAAGTGKTWLTQYIACQLSTGGVILNGLAECKPQKVVIMSGETGAELMNKRLAKTNWTYEPHNISLYSSIDMGLADVNCMIDTPDGQETVIAILASEKPDIVFFDTLISFHGKDESKQGEMTSIYMFTCRLAKAFNCAVVCNHHTRKRPANNPEREQNQDDVIGSSAGVRLANAVYVVSSDDLGQGMSKMTVKNVKAWDKKVPPFSYKFVNNGEFVDFLIEHKINVEWSAREIITRLIHNMTPNSYLSTQDISDTTGLNEDLIRYHLDKSDMVKRVKIASKTLYALKTDNNSMFEKAE